MKGRYVNRKSYGVSGLMEWTVLVPAGNSFLRVEFTGGTMNGYGISPATFTTSDPVVQRIIEESVLYRSGRIRSL